MTPNPQANGLDEDELVDEMLKITEKLGELTVKYILYVDSSMGDNIQVESQVLPPQIKALIAEARIDEVKRIDPTSDYVLNDLVMSVGYRLTQLKEKL